jgi:resuscitation-promoting factor RpfB
MLGNIANWFSALSVAGKVGVITATVVAGGTGVAAINSEPQTESLQKECIPSTTQETETKVVNYDFQEIKEPNLDKGKIEIRTKGVNGENKLTYEVTKYSPDGCKQSTKTLVNKEVVKKPSTQITAVGTYVAPPPPPECDSNYSGCVPISSDVDCAGGSGNGPAYVSGPVYVTGDDIYGLDGNGDGVGCEY